MTLKGRIVGQTMKRYNCYVLMVVAFLLMLSCSANMAVQSAAKTTLEDMTGKNLAKLYKVKAEAENPDQREVIIRACISGLYAIGDSKNAKKINQGWDRDEFVSSLMGVCDLCRGEGCSSEGCYKCKESGACQNRKCNKGTVMGVGFDGKSSARKCSTCGGSGKCTNCKGTGVVARTCSRCNGLKRIIDKGVALASCKDMLYALIDGGNEMQGRKKVEGAFRLTRQMVEKENQDREKAETDVRLAGQNAEDEKRAHVKAEEDVRLAAQKAMDEKLEHEKAEESARLARVKEENEKLAREKMVSSKVITETGRRNWLKDAGGDVHRSHGFMSVQSNVFDDFTIRIHVLPNGAYNTIVLRNKYKAPEMIKEYRGGQLSAVWRPMGCTAKVLSTKTVIFNGNVDKVFGAFRMAFQKAREWIELSKKEGKTPSDSLDMNIEVPDGCALEIPNDDDADFVLNKLQNSKDLKKMKSGFKFWFSDKDRVLLFQCGDETFDFRWSAKQDKRTLTCAESACDEKLLLQLYAGRPGEADLFDVGQRYSKMPSVRNSQAIPKWASGVGDRAALKFPNGMMVGMARCSDGSVNYFFSPYMVGPFLTTVLIFPDDSRDDAYHAIEEAFRIALAWKSIAQKHHILNIVKEMKVPCPKSAAVEITGTKGAVELLWKSVSNADLSVMPTKFWFTVETQQTLKDGKWGYEQENTKYYLHFGNDDSQKYLELNDSTIASVGSLNPQLALRAMDAAVQNKAKEKSIFK